MGVSGEKESNRERKTMMIYISSGPLIHLVLGLTPMAGRRVDFELHIHTHTFRLLVVGDLLQRGRQWQLMRAHMHIKYHIDVIYDRI